MEEKNFVSDRRAGEWELFRMFKRDIIKIPMLSREQEIAAARRARSGDQTAIDLLVESNLRLVIYIVHKHWYPGLPLMDMISIGCVGLLNAARNFDPEQNIKFVTYAFPAIKHEVWRAIHDYYLNRHDSLDDPVSEDNETTQKDLLVSDTPGADAMVADKETQGALVGLDGLERRIIFLRYWLGQELDRVAAKLGYSRCYVARLENRALRKMRWSMTGDFIKDQRPTSALAGVMAQNSLETQSR